MGVSCCPSPSSSIASSISDPFGKVNTRPVLFLPLLLSHAERQFLSTGALCIEPTRFLRALYDPNAPGRSPGLAYAVVGLACDSTGVGTTTGDPSSVDPGRGLGFVLTSSCGRSVSGLVMSSRLCCVLPAPPSPVRPVGRSVNFLVARSWLRVAFCMRFFGSSMTVSGVRLEFFVFRVVWAAGPDVVAFWGSDTVLHGCPPFALVRVLVPDMVLVLGCGLLGWNGGREYSQSH